MKRLRLLSESLEEETSLLKQEEILAPDIHKYKAFRFTIHKSDDGTYGYEIHLPLNEKPQIGFEMNGIESYEQAIQQAHTKIDYPNGYQIDTSRLEL